MPISKLKNLVILILLLANLALLALLIPRQAAQYRQQQELRSSLSTLCQSHNVALEPGCVPDTITLYPLELTEYDLAAEAVGSKLLGEDMTMSVGQSEITCTSPAGHCTISASGGITATLTDQKEVSHFVRATDTLLRKLDFDRSATGEPVRVRAGVYTVTAQQSILGVPVFCQGLTMTYSNSCLTQMEGEYLMGTLTKAADTACIAATDAVVCFLSERVALGWVGSAITGLEQGYCHTEGSAKLTPAWKLTTDTGTFFVDGLSGEVSPVD